MSVALDEALARLRDLARDDEGLAATLVFLAAEDAADPFERPSEAVLTSARALNAARTRQRLEELAGRCLDTAGVVRILATVNDRKGVDRRRHRGSLFGIRVGSRIAYPLWQFDRRRGDTFSGLTEVITALGKITDDAVAADAIMTIGRDDLGGRSLADLLAAGNVAGALRLLDMAGDQS